jgi:transposase
LAKAGDDTLKGSRQLWLFAQENVPEKRREEFAALVRADLQTAKAWAAKETLRRTWQQPSVEAARAHIQAWLTHVAEHLPGPMHAFSLMVRKKLEPIIRYYAHPLTTGKAEGINNKLMAIHRRARGFRSHASFRIAALFHGGGLNP